MLNHDMLLINEVLLFSEEEGYMVVLKENKEAMQYFQMFVGEGEFLAIAKEQQLIDTPRPLTHELYLGLLQNTGLTFICVEIYGLEDRTYLARVVFRFENGPEQGVECRPSDGVALALHQGIPITVNSGLLKENGPGQDNKKDSLESFVKSVRF